LEILSTDNLSVESLHPSNANLIESNNNSTDTNIFCFAAIADKQTSILYNNLMGPFLFMSLKGNVCFLIVSHYETNAILAFPIKGFSDNIIVAAYKQQFNLLESKGYKIRLNVMDNQATQVINRFLETQDCDLLLVEPHNHRVNVVEGAIQMFNAHFISALATTDSNFPLQLWDRLTPQVEEYDVPVPHQPQHISPRSYPWPIRLEPLPASTPGMQSSNLQIPQSPQLVGQ
jgi:hypothetical protein